MNTTSKTDKRSYHRPTLTKHGSVEELTLTFGHHNPNNLYGHIHNPNCGHNGMPGS